MAVAHILAIGRQMDKRIITNLRTACSTEQVLGKLGVHSNALVSNYKTNK